MALRACLYFEFSKMKRASCERGVLTWSVWHAVWLLTYFPHVGQSGEMLHQNLFAWMFFLVHSDSDKTPDYDFSH